MNKEKKQVKQIKLILDIEWIQLMQQAKGIGLTPKDVLMFLKRNVEDR